MTIVLAVSFAKNKPGTKVALSAGRAHPRPMAKTWVPKNDVKSAKAFARAIRMLSPKGGGRRHNNNSRPPGR